MIKDISIYSRVIYIILYFKSGRVRRFASQRHSRASWCGRCCGEASESSTFGCAKRFSDSDVPQHFSDGEYVSTFLSGTRTLWCIILIIYFRFVLRAEELEAYKQNYIWVLMPVVVPAIAFSFAFEYFALDSWYALSFLQHVMWIYLYKLLKTILLFICSSNYIWKLSISRNGNK